MKEFPQIAEELGITENEVVAAYTSALRKIKILCKKYPGWAGYCRQLIREDPEDPGQYEELYRLIQRIEEKERHLYYQEEDIYLEFLPEGEYDEYT